MPERTNAIEQLIKHLGFHWRDEGLLQTALTHTSYANENKAVRRIEHNQRLEFLGDAVLELVVSEDLFRIYPHHSEGVLTKSRAAVVCEPSLARVANQLNLGSCLLMGKGEERSGGRERPSILADVFEALIGAVYLDQGLETARRLVIDQLTIVINTFGQGGHAGDYKSELQELVQQEGDNLLVYQILQEEGPDHDKTFTAGVKYRGHSWGIGKGRTKKESEQAAAQVAMERYRLEKGIGSGDGDE
ncbi:MAG: ribonuclease III [Thermincolia bacterium]